MGTWGPQDLDILIVGTWGPQDLEAFPCSAAGLVLPEGKTNGLSLAVCLSRSFSHIYIYICTRIDYTIICMHHTHMTSFIETYHRVYTPRRCYPPATVHPAQLRRRFKRGTIGSSLRVSAKDLTDLMMAKVRIDNTALRAAYLVVPTSVPGSNRNKKRSIKLETPI